MTRQTTQRNQPDRTPRFDEEEFADLVGELRTLWRLMTAALARDSAGQFTSDRQAKGARDGSSATVNVDVVDAAVIVETGVSKLLAELVPILNLERRPRSIDQVLSLLPDWRRSLEARDQPLAKYLVRDVKSWRRAVRQAIGVRKYDERAGIFCPDHRDDEPTELRIEGAKAEIAPTLLAGPPMRWLLLAGPACGCVERPIAEQRPTASGRRARRRLRREARHTTCEWIAERRLIDAGTGKFTDWRLGGEGDLLWSSMDETHAFEWRHSTAITCPHCKRAWTDTNQQRLLVAELRALGDKRSAAMEAIIR